MSSIRYIVRLGDRHVHVTSDEISSTGRAFQWHRTRFDESQRLKLCIGAELVEPIGRTNEGDERKFAIIAAVFQLLTEGRDVKAARRHIKSNEGKAWLRKLVVPETLDMIQEIPNTAGITRSPTYGMAHPDSHALDVSQYVNSPTVPLMEDASQGEGPDSDAATALQIPGMGFLVFLLASVFLATIFMILTAISN